MDSLLDTIGINNIIYILGALVIVLLIAFLIILGKVIVLNKRYKKFMLKLGEGKDLQEDLVNYMYKVERVEKENVEI